jgi:Protein of unknown function (DUF2924)
MNLSQQIAQLQRMTTKQLQARFAELFGEETPANNRTWLLRRIAWRLQSLAEGDLSERARLRAAELAKGSDLRTGPPILKMPPPPEPDRTTVLRFKQDEWGFHVAAGVMTTGGGTHGARSVYLSVWALDSP